MRSWVSVSLLVVVLLKWIGGAHGSRGFCFQPENYRLCKILLEHNVSLHKRYLQFGRKFGNLYARFGRSGTNVIDDDVGKRLESLLDKAYLRFGRTSTNDDDNTNYAIHNANYYNYDRQRRDSEVVDVGGATHDTDVLSRRRRSVDDFHASDDESMGPFEPNYISAPDRRSSPLGRLLGFPGPRDNNEYDNRFNRYERYNTNGWIHFGKRTL